MIVSSGWWARRRVVSRGGGSGTRRRSAHCTQRWMKPPIAVITFHHCTIMLGLVLQSCSQLAASPATHQANAAVNPAGILRRLQSVDNEATNRSEGRCGSRYIPLPRTGRLAHMVFKLGGWLALTRRIDIAPSSHIIPSWLCTQCSTCTRGRPLYRWSSKLRKGRCVGWPAN